MVLDFFGTLQIIHNYVEGSLSKHAIFEQIRKSIVVKLKTLKSFSTTKWAYRAEAVRIIPDNF